MLLSLMRKHAKSYLIKVLIAIIAVVFIFYFGYSFRSREGVKVASVNGEPITSTEYQKAYKDLLESLRRQYRDMWSENLIEAFDLKRQALQQLIDQRLITQEARRLGLDVTEDEIRSEIMSYPAFQFQGRFHEGRYRAVLDQNRMTPEDFERTVAQALLKDKADQFLTAFQPVTDHEVREYYRYLNLQTKVQYVAFDPADFREGIRLEPAEVEEYFENRKEEYRIPDKISVKYIKIEPSTFFDQIKISEEQLKAYYQENIERYKEKKRVKAKHILFRLDQKATEEEEAKVKQKALEVLNKAKKGEDFSELAKTYSEGPSKDQGGDVGYFSRGEMVEGFEEAAFKLEEGEISDLVRTGFGYHIIKVEDIQEARTRPFEEVRGEIAEHLTSVRASDIAHEEALSLMDQMPYEVDLKEHAGSHGLLVHDTGLFSRGEEIPGLGESDKLEEVLFNLERGAVSDVIEFNDSFFIFQVDETRPSHLPQLAGVREEVREDLLSERAREKARAKAQEVLERLRQGGDWEAVVGEQGLSPQTTDFFKRNQAVPGLGNNPVLQEAAFRLDEDDPYPEEVFETESGVVIMRWAGSRDIDEESLAEEKEDYLSSIREMKHRVLFEAWLRELRERAEIRIEPLPGLR